MTFHIIFTKVRIVLKGREISIGTRPGAQKALLFISVIMRPTSLSRRVELIERGHNDTQACALLAQKGHDEVPKNTGPQQQARKRKFSRVTRRVRWERGEKGVREIEGFNRGLRDKDNGVYSVALFKCFI